MEHEDQDMASKMAASRKKNAGIAKVDSSDATPCVAPTKNLGVASSPSTSKSYAGPFA